MSIFGGLNLKVGNATLRKEVQHPDKEGHGKALKDSISNGQDNDEIGSRDTHGADRSTGFEHKKLGTGDGENQRSRSDATELAVEENSSAFDFISNGKNDANGLNETVYSGIEAIKGGASNDESFDSHTQAASEGGTILDSGNGNTKYSAAEDIPKNFVAIKSAKVKRKRPVCRLSFARKPNMDGIGSQSSVLDQSVENIETAVSSSERSRNNRQVFSLSDTGDKLNEAKILDRVFVQEKESDQDELSDNAKREENLRDSIDRSGVSQEYSKSSVNNDTDTRNSNGLIIDAKTSPLSRENSEEDETGSIEPPYCETAKAVSNLLAKFQEKSKAYATDIAEVAGLQSDFFQSTKSLDIKTESLKREVLSLEKDQGYALQQEDFERAGQIQENVESLNRELEKLDSLNVVLCAKSSKLMERKMKIYAEHIAAIDDVLANYSVCHKNDVEAMGMHLDQFGGKIESIRSNITEELDKLCSRRDDIHSELESVVDEKKKLLEGEGTEESKLLDEKNRCDEAINSLDASIAELEAKLATKRKAREELLTNLNKVNENINISKEKHDMRTEDLEQQADAARISGNELERQIRDKTLLLQGLESKNEKSRKAMDDLEQNWEKIDVQLLAMNDFASLLKTSGNFTNDYESGETERKVNEETFSKERILEETHQELVATSEQTRELRSRLDNVDEDIVKLGEKLSTIQAQLSILMQKKQQAVSSRNFGLAGHTAAAIKNLNSEKLSLDELLSESEAERQTYLNRMKELKDHETELRNRIPALKVEIENFMLESLASRKQGLQTLRERLQGTHDFGDGTLVGSLLLAVSADIEACDQHALGMASKMKLADACTDDASEPKIEVHEEAQPLESALVENAVIEHVVEYVVEVTELSHLRERIKVLCVRVEEAVEKDEFELAEELDNELSACHERLSELETQQSDEPLHGLEDEQYAGSKSESSAESGNDEN